MRVDCHGDYNVDLDDVLSQLSDDELLEELRKNDRLCSFADALGKDWCAEYFGLVERKEAAD